MESNNLDKFKENLAQRAQLSIKGKAIIGLAGGVIILISGWFKTCNNHDSVLLETPNVTWISYVLDSAIPLDSIKRVVYFVKLGVAVHEADSIATLISNRNKNGTNISELDKIKIDSLNRTFKLSIPMPDSNSMIFYIKSLESKDYILVMKDSLINKIISF